MVNDEMQYFKGTSNAGLSTRNWKSAVHCTLSSANEVFLCKMTMNILLSYCHSLILKRNLLLSIKVHRLLRYLFLNKSYKRICIPEMNILGIDEYDIEINSTHKNFGMATYVLETLNLSNNIF